MQTLMQKLVNIPKVNRIREVVHRLNEQFPQYAHVLNSWEDAHVIKYIYNSPLRFQKHGYF